MRTYRQDALLLTLLFLIPAYRANAYSAGEAAESFAIVLLSAAILTTIVIMPFVYGLSGRGDKKPSFLLVLKRSLIILFIFAFIVLMAFGLLLE